MDEFHEFATESFVSLLPEARKFHLNLILAHQYLEQLSHDVQSAIMGNVGRKIVFQLGYQDARIMAEEFTHKFSIDDFINLPQFNMCIKLMINGMVSVGFSGVIRNLIKYCLILNQIY